MKFSSPNAPIFLVLWIMLQPLAMWVCAMLSEEFAASMSPDYMGYYSFPSGVKVGFAQLECAIGDMIGVAIVGAIIVSRHKVGGRKFWIHSGIWYAVYLILTMSAIYCIADDWGAGWETQPCDDFSDELHISSVGDPHTGFCGQGEKVVEKMPVEKK